jgi:uncharacterized protein (DUF983 family)
MSRPKCPNCGAKPYAAFFKSKLRCPLCGTELESDLTLVSFVESLVCVVPVYLLIAQIEKALSLNGSQNTFAALLLLPIALVIHWAIVCRFVSLRRAS